VIHQTLEAIIHEGIHAWDDQRASQQHTLWRIQLLQKGFNDSAVGEAIKTIHQAITNTLKDQQGQWLLDNTHEQSATELELWDKKGQHIIDRTFIDTNSQEGRTRWIIDYKSSQPPESQTMSSFKKEQKEQYQHQLKRYQSLFKHEKIHIRCALYYPLLSLFLEI